MTATASDFYALRREGVGHVERTGAAAWTDYNTHDPGISILESIAYAITELAYRSGFPIEDILASVAVNPTLDDPYPGQTFHSARTILTVNPTTAQDLRRLLIDVREVRNAWVRCKACGCDAPFFAWCEDDELVLSHDPSQRDDPATIATKVEPRGLYDVLLELEADPDHGDLNDRKIARRRTVVDPEGRRHTITVEVRFPAWGLARRDERQQLADDDQVLTPTVVGGPRRTISGTTPVDDAELRSHWFDPFYVDVEVELADTTKILIPGASVRLYGDGVARGEATVQQLTEWLEDKTTAGFVEPYRAKLSVADAAVAVAKEALHAHRNLDEDYCHVELVEIDEIAVCADVEVEPTADIELVQARIWFEIERYLDPPVEFWSRDELLAAGQPVEAIFNGPELDHGFLTDAGLAATDLRTELRVSDILDRLVSIPGVTSVDNLLLTAYDASGSPIHGIADPTWVDGTPVFDASRVSAAWLLFLAGDHRPRLHRRLSRFLFSANGLPFVPRIDEAEDTLVQLHGQAARPKIRDADRDLPIPLGRSRALDRYFPVQHGFPLVYGIGPAGLPSTATPERRAQAKQLKAYLMVYEQLLRNAFAQLAHAGDLFSTDAAVERTYFAELLDEEIVGYGDIVPSLSAAQLDGMVESETDFRERRNGFLDHLLARFGESFDEYAFLLTDLEGRSRAASELIRDKLAFLDALPRAGHDRGKAFNRVVDPTDPDNTSGLQQRVGLLLGMPDLTFEHRSTGTFGDPGWEHHLDLVVDGQALLSFPLADTLDPADTAALAALRRELLAALTQTDRYEIAHVGSTWKVTVRDALGAELGERAQGFPTRSGAAAFVEELAAWAAHERAILVEHLLLRPKFPGDALYPACADGGCSEGCAGCGDEDPYSFRLTFAVPGWTAPFSTNIAMRSFADRTIREQTPSHLVVKTCWVGDDGFIADPCHPIVDELAELLVDRTASRDAACRCASDVLGVYSAVFDAWFETHDLLYDPPDVVAAELQAHFDAEVDLGPVSCAADIDDAVWAELQDVLVDHFVDIARHGYQFERFESAWLAWVASDAAIDWTAERLQDTVVELLAGSVVGDVDHEALCTCAATVIAAFGTEFREWMDANVAAGRALDEFTAFAPSPPALCAGLTFDAGAAAAVGELLGARYAAYTEVSYRLRVLVHELAGLRNDYPTATLHDCDEGSDLNPVRLGQTALGSN